MALPGGGPPPHTHHFEDESFYMLQGNVTFQAAGQTFRASPGDFIHIPGGTVHSFRNEGRVDAKALIVISPAGALRACSGSYRVVFILVPGKWVGSGRADG